MISKNEARRHYVNRACASAADFDQDYRRAHNIRRMLDGNRSRGQRLNHRLVVNHIVTMRNVFDPDFVVRHVRETVGPENRVAVDTFLEFLDMGNVDMVDDDLMSTIRGENEP